MPAPVVGNRREGFQLQARDEATHFHFVMSDFAPSNEQHSMLLQARGKSRIYSAEFPASSAPLLQGGGIRNSTAVYSDDSRTDDLESYPYGKGSRKNDITAPPMSAEAAGLFSADEYAGTGNVSEIICSPDGDAARQQHDEQRNRVNDLFLLHWPELGGFEDFEADLRKFGSTFENYFDDPMWPSICSPDAQLVRSSQFYGDENSSAVASKSAANPILEPTLSVPDSTDQTKMANLISMQQLSKNKGREAPSPYCSSSEEIGRFPQHLLCPFDDMLVPASPPSILCNDEIISSSSTTSVPDELVSAYVPRCSAKKKTHTAPTPDMILDEMAGNPLEMYFPPLTTYEQPEVPMSGASSTQMRHQLLPGGFAGEGAISGLEFGLRGTRTPRGGLRDNSPSSSITKAGPVKHLGFQKLQDGMNQLDVGTKTCIRDALYRLANNVEQRHCVDQTLGSSGVANRLKKSSIVWTKTQGSPMDRSVVQLLLQKPLNQKATDRQQANRVA